MSVVSVAQRAQREVVEARKVQKELEDEACLFNAAVRATQGTVDAIEDLALKAKDKDARKSIIDTHVARQVALLMGTLLSPAIEPGVVPPGLSYAVQVDASKVSNAGRGLMIRGSAKPGDLVAFYPGSVYTAHEINWFGNFDAMMTRAKALSRAYLLGRQAGGVLIDGLGSGFVFSQAEDPQFYHHLEKRDATEFDAPVNAGMRNVWANGHFINHPPKGTHANVIGWPYDFPSNTPESLLELLPNTFAIQRENQPRKLSRSTICMIAATPLNDGDELFLDYGFEYGPSDSLPPWFSAATHRGDEFLSVDSSPVPNARDVVREKLLQWKSRFEQSNGRPPSRADMMNDPVASGLFEEFQTQSKLEWPSNSQKGE